MLPTDGHVHTEWSWDAAGGSMEATCARAVRLGLASIAFTDHADHTRWVIEPGLRAQLGPVDAARIGPDGQFTPPPLAVADYLACIERCRARFPELRILAGLEIGEPHWHADRVRTLIGAGEFDRLLGAVHTLMLDGPRMIDHLVGRVTAAELMRGYLEEALRLAGSTAPFGALAHIDYPLRKLPGGLDRVEVTDYEAEYRAVLEALAGAGRALEINTRVPLPVAIVRWWYEAGGDALTFGSDAHDPSAVASDFAHAVAMAESVGFCPGRRQHDPWQRHARLG